MQVAKNRTFDPYMRVRGKRYGRQRSVQRGAAAIQDVLLAWEGKRQPPENARARRRLERKLKKLYAEAWAEQG